MSAEEEKTEAQLAYEQDKVDFPNQADNAEYERFYTLDPDVVRPHQAYRFMPDGK